MNTNKKRKLFLGFCLLGAILILPLSSFTQNTKKKAVLQYVRSLQRNGCEYGWPSQYDGHITPTYAAVGTLKNLNSLSKDQSALIEWVRGHHPQTGKNAEAGPSFTVMRNIVYQQMQTIAWLGGDLDSFKEDVAKWKPQRKANANYEETKFGNLWQETFTPISFKLLHLPLNRIQQEFAGYLDTLKRVNGSYGNVPSFLDSNGDGNILCTINAIKALKALQQDIPLKDELINWLRSCQRPDGGFMHQPKPELAKNADVIYTWAGVKSLRLLNAWPQDIKSCISYILSLQNSDGGFGNKPGIASTPMSTYYAVDALRELNALAYLDKPFKAVAPKKNIENFKGENIYTVQFQSVGNGSPKEAVFLAKEFKIDLWGAKNSPPGWIEEAQRVADKDKVPVHFFITDEPYNKNVIVPGMGKFGHILDYYAKAGKPMDLPAEATWSELRDNYFKPLLKNEGGLILQVSNNEPVARLLLDESIDNGGYTALATHHFDQNFAFWLPYLFDYSNRLPMVCLQDGHGLESWWWADYLFKERTLFVAKDASYTSMVSAVKKNHIVSVRHDTATRNITRMMGASDAVRNFISSNDDRWKWWKETGDNNDLPWGVITTLFPGDKFEQSAPESGVAIRVRCWRKTKTMTLLEPVTDLMHLYVDGKEVKFEVVEKKNQRGQLQDVYYLYNMPDITVGKHVIEARFKKLSNDDTKAIKTYFYVK